MSSPVTIGPYPGRLTISAYHRALKTNVKTKIKTDPRLVPLHQAESLPDQETTLGSE